MLTRYEKVIIWICFIFLFISGAFHILMQQAAGELMAKEGMVKAMGAICLVVGIMFLFSKKKALFYSGVHIIFPHGVLRFFFSSFSITIMEVTYPRWVHGILLLLGAFAVLLIPYYIYREKKRSE